MCLNGAGTEVNSTGFDGAKRASRAGGRRSPISTSPRACEVRVTPRISTTLFISSESSYAQRVMSFSSWKVPGSSSGRFAHLATMRESSSSVLDSAPGSSQVTRTMPAFVPVSASPIR